MNAIANIKASIRLQQWAQQVDECQKSGLSVSAWCKANGIRTNTCYYRLKQVRESTLEKLRPAADHQPEAEDTCISFKQLQVQSSVNILVRVYRCSGGTDTANPAAGNRCSGTGIPHLIDCLLPASLLA